MRRAMFVLAVMFVLSACSSGTDTATSTLPAGDGTVVSEVDETTTTAEEVATEEIVDTTTTVPDAVPSGSASCVGVWELDSEAFFDSYNETAAPTERIAFLSGRYVVTWNADSTFTDERLDWMFEFPGMEEGGAMVMNSIGAGQWSDDGGEIVITSYELTEPRLSMILDGEEFELPVTPGALPAGAFDERTVAVCSDLTMVSSSDGVVVTFDRIG